MKNTRLKILKWVLVLYIIPLHLEGQLNRFYTPYQGLSNTFFYDITQDSEGFIWIGTSDGLNRFDGYNFSVYHAIPNDNTSLLSNEIHCVFIDSDDQLWVGTDVGLQIYNRELDNFSNFELKYNDIIQWTLISDMLEDNEGNIWLSTSIGFIKINKDRKGYQFYNAIPEANNTFRRNLMNTLLLDNNGIWIASEKQGLYFYNFDNDSLINYQHNNKNSISDNSILSLAKDNNGNIIIGTVKGGMSIYQKEKQRFITIPYSHNKKNPFNGSVYSLVKGDNNNIWVGTERNGLKILNTGNYHLENANHLVDLTDMSDSKVHLYEDRKGNLWMGIDYSGIYILQSKTKPFHSYQKSGSEALSNNVVKSIVVDHEKNLWVGTDGGGLNLLKNGSTHFINYLNQPKDKTTLSDNAVIALYNDNRDRVWIGTYLGGLSLYNPKTNSFESFLINRETTGRDYNYVVAIVPKNDTELWIGTNGGGLHIFNTETKTFTDFISLIVQKRKINLPMFLTTLMLDKENNLWIGSYNGLYCINEISGLYKGFSTSNGQLDQETIHTIHEGSDGRVWFGTGSGLHSLNKTNWEIHKYTIANGLPNNTVYGILEDDSCNLWISTLNGISKFNCKKNIIRNYYTYDGLAGNEYRPASCYKDKDGVLYFGSNSGLVFFDPDQIKDVTDFPNLIMTKLKNFNKTVQIGEKVNGHLILTKSINETKQIRLPFSNNNFTIEFAAIDYCAPEKIKYACKLEGFDDNWFYRDFNHRFAAYTNLNPGTYHFKLKSTNIDGIWNKNIKSFTVIIDPPWWRSVIAYIIYSIVSAFLFLLIRRLVMFRIEMKNKLRLEHLELEKLEELNQSKMQFFSNVSHEFRTPLTLIMGPVQRLLESELNSSLKKQVGFIHRNAVRMYRLVNLLLDFQKVEKNQMKLQASFGDIISFAKEVTFSFNELASQKKITLDFISDIEKLDIWFDPDKLDKVIFNLLSNAFKFTPNGGMISVEINKDFNDAFDPPLNKYVVITVKDTGRGIAEEKLNHIFERFYQIENAGSVTEIGTGIGLHLSKFLVELHHGRITVSSKIGLGTRFDILLPLESEHLSEEEKSLTGSTEFNTAYINEANQPDSEIVTETKTESEFSRILIVEDDIEIREYIKSELKKSYKIYEATDGIEGWNMTKKELPDLVISDIMMPKMDGIQLCKRIKSEIQTSHIPVILLTARTSVENRIEGLESGADAYIPKPFHPKLLLVRIQKLIELRRQLVSKFSKSLGFEAKEITFTSVDEKFLQKSIDLVVQNMANPEFNIEDMSDKIGMSRVHMYRKLKALTGQSPSEFVRTIRLKQAAQMLSHNKINVSEVAYQVGFNSHQYFSSCFQNYFNMSPSEYIAKMKDKELIE